MIGQRIARGARWGLPILAAFVFTGCEALTGSDDDGPGLGEFTVTITGDVEASGSGMAGHYTNVDGTDSFWELVMFVEDEDSGISLIIYRLGARPGVGDQEFTDTPEDGDWFGIVTVMEEGLTSLFAFPVSGGFEITSSSDDQVSGSFSFEAVGIAPGTPEEELSVTVEGTFNADGDLDFDP